jgi:hypothetical protein
MNKELLNLKQKWIEDGNINVGRDIYHLVKNEFNLIKDIIEYMILISPNNLELLKLKKFIEAKNEFQIAHEKFDYIRKLLRYEEEHNLTKDNNRICLLYVIEIILKLIYNSTNPKDPFDSDTGWWLVLNFRSFLQTFNNKEILKNGWSVIENNLSN